MANNNNTRILYKECPVCGNKSVLMQATRCDICHHDFAVYDKWQKKQKKRGCMLPVFVGLSVVLIISLMIIIMNMGDVIDNVQPGDNMAGGNPNNPGSSVATTQAANTQPPTTQPPTTQPPTTQAPTTQPSTVIPMPSTRVPDNIYFVGVSDSNANNYDAVANPNLYAMVNIDSEFSFGYPMNFFNRVETYSDSYLFYTNSGTATMRVAVENTVGNDAIQCISAYYASKVKEVYTGAQGSGVSLRSDKVKNGWAHALVGGSYYDGRGSTYYIVVSNGAKVYSITFDYQDISVNNYYNAQSYMIDCIYRLCSHSGSSYKIRSYQQFLKDDMGEKRDN